MYCSFYFVYVFFRFSQLFSSYVSFSLLKKFKITFELWKIKLFLLFGFPFGIIEHQNKTKIFSWTFIKFLGGGGEFSPTILSCYLSVYPTVCLCIPLYVCVCYCMFVYTTVCLCMLLYVCVYYWMFVYTTVCLCILTVCLCILLYVCVYMPVVSSLMIIRIVNYEKTRNICIIYIIYALCLYTLYRVFLLH